MSVRELAGIQVLRGLAALAVVLHHALEESAGARSGAAAPDWLTTAGAAGVDVFFVISGFIMVYTTFAARDPSLSPARFLLKRAVRIYPLYWIVCLVGLSLHAGGLYKSWNIDGPSLVNALLLIPGTKPFIGVAWTLVFEVTFYLCFAVALLARRMVTTIVLTACLIGAMIAVGHATPESSASAFMSNPISLEFCFGMALAWAFIAFPSAVAINPANCVVAAAALLLAPAIIAHPSTNGLLPEDRVWAWGVPATLLVAATLRLRPSETILGRSLVLFGDASYSIYLTHIFVMVSYAKLLASTSLAQLPQALVVVAVFAAATCLGVIAHVGVERPLLRLSRRAFVSRDRTRNEHDERLQTAA